MCDPSCYASFIWQQSFYDQYMQNHAALTQWMLVHQNQLYPDYSVLNMCGSRHYYNDGICSGQREYRDSTTADHIVQETSEWVEEEIESEDKTGSSDEESEFEFNVDAILAMRAAKEELQRQESSATSNDSDCSFVIVKSDKEEDVDYIDYGSKRAMDYERQNKIGAKSMQDQQEINKKIREHIYGEKSSTIAGLETAMAINFEHLYDKLQPPLWPVLPARL